MVIVPLDLDKGGTFLRRASRPGVPNRILSSWKYLRTSVGVEADGNPVIFRAFQWRPFWFGSLSLRWVLVLDLCRRILHSAEGKFYSQALQAASPSQSPCHHNQDIFAPMKTSFSSECFSFSVQSEVLGAVTVRRGLFGTSTSVFCLGMERPPKCVWHLSDDIRRLLRPKGQARTRETADCFDQEADGPCIPIEMLDRRFPVLRHYVGRVTCFYTEIGCCARGRCQDR